MNACCRESLNAAADVVDGSRNTLSWWFRLLGAGWFVQQVANTLREYARRPEAP